MVTITHKNDIIRDNKKPELKIAITTPYLYKSVEASEFNKEELEKQIQKYGYNPKNLQDTTFLETDKYLLRLENPTEHTAERPEDCHLVIAGCTEDAEARVHAMIGSGALVGRYSIFYGKPSGYTDIKPGAAGYAFDIPKDVDTIKAMLANDELLEAILEREEKKIVRAIDVLNTKISMPILITSYLTEALKIKPIWKTGVRPPEYEGGTMDTMFDYMELRMGIEGGNR